MIETFLAPENRVFSICLSLMLLLGILELVGAMFGAGLSDLLEGFLPEQDLGLAHDNALNQFFGWLKIDQVPALISLIVFLLEFSLVGFSVQIWGYQLTGDWFSAWLAVPPVFLLTLPLLRVSLAGLGKVMPKDETTAVSEDSFIGRVAVITLGVARIGAAAEAKVKDQHGYSHYLLVEPDLPEIEFSQGEAVLLVSRHSAVYKAIPADNPSLL
jgi:hypothetical protein